MYDGRGQGPSLDCSVGCAALLSILLLIPMLIFVGLWAMAAFWSDSTTIGQEYGRVADLITTLWRR